MKPSQSRLKYIKGLLHSFYWRKVQTYLYLGIADLRIGFKNFMGFEGTWECMNVLSFLPNEKEREICKIEIDFNKFCWCSNLSNDDWWWPGLKMGMDFRGQVWEQVWEMTFLVWNRFRIRRTRWHSPTKNSQEYTLGVKLHPSN